MTELLEFIVKYWLQFALGLIASCLTFGIKKYYTIKKKEFELEIVALREAIIKDIDEKLKVEMEKSNAEDKRIRADMNRLDVTMKSLIQGLLSVQGKNFREECERLLLQDYINVVDYEQFEEDYAAYKALGGNHRGDALHARVVDKYVAQLHKK
jgi:hypothetical protein